MKKNFVAYCADNAEFEFFETFEEAKKWLTDVWDDSSSDEGIGAETINGNDFIAKITHRSKFVETDNKKDYCQIDCCDCTKEKCDGEEWPYSSEFESVCNVMLEKVEADE
jgi:hypothetical protein